MSLFQTDKTKLIMFILDRYQTRYNHRRYTWQKIRCINQAAHPRGDRNPSASVSLEFGYYRCHACSLEGDGYDVLRQLEGLDVKQVNQLFGGEPVKQGKVKDEWL